VSEIGGLRVLVVEDDPLVSMLIEAMLEDLGCQPVGPLMRVAEALDFLKDGTDGFDVALLDVNVAGERIEPVAEILDAAGVRFAFSTGYGDAGLPERWRGAATLQKPYSMEDVRVALEKLAVN
jgi:CheY-like chemotaxis protein